MPDTLIQATLQEGRDARTLAAAAVVLGLALLLRLCAPAEAERARASVFFLGAHLLTLVLAAGLSMASSPATRHVRLAALVLELTAVVTAVIGVLFAVVLPRLRLRAPLILREVVAAASLVIGFFVLASGAGYNLSGLIATSTVLTAIIGLSFQDTLGNVMAGLALQMDQSVAVGDWIRTGDVVGKVIQIRWRFTSVETRNWETVVIPNSVLVKNQFLVLGRRQGQPEQLRRWVWFNVDYRWSPAEVIETVEHALRAAPLEGVAEEPPAQCVIMDLAESYGKYAMRYWLTDLAHDDGTDSLVRTRVYYALKRADIPLSLPAHAVFLTEESSERKARKSDQEVQRRGAALGRVDLFDELSEEDRARLAESLHFAPFTRGEAMTRQGDEAHWLYMMVEGEAAVSVTENGLTTEVNRLGPGDFFGEMGLMTGATRSATVTALTDVTCYRLGKAAFQEIIRNRPELAEKVAEVLASRRWRLQAKRDDLDAASHALQLQARRDLAGRIRGFFGLD